MKLSQSDYVALYLPKTARKITHKHSDAVAYAYNDERGNPCGCVFFGKQGKPIWRYRFANEAAREKRVTDAFNARAEVAALKLSQREARKAWQHDFEEGDIFRCSWGYDQTNIDYYEVLSVSGKMLTIQQIRGISSDEEGFMTARKIPNPGDFIGKPFKVIPQMSSLKDGPKSGYIKISSCQYARFNKPTEIAGVKVYDADRYSWYA